MLAKTTSNDLGTALGVTTAGVIALAVAIRVHWTPNELGPGMEGILTATVVGFGMALLHGFSFQRVLALSAVTTAAQYAVCAAVAGTPTAIGITGLQLLMMGFVGLALTVRERDLSREPASESEATAEPRSTGSASPHGVVTHA